MWEIKRKKNGTCLKHLPKADGEILGGVIWSKTLPVALKSGMTSIKTVTETSPKHKTSAFFTLGKPSTN